MISKLQAEVVAEYGRWSVMLPGLPIAAEGDTVGQAVNDVIGALREYAADWHDHLRWAPNHEAVADLVHRLDLSTDDEIGRCVIGAPIVQE